MSREAIVVDGVWKRFRTQTAGPGSLKELITRRNQVTSREFWALKDVSFEIPPGSLYALLGHNGSGKSTLLRCIAGIYRTTKGSIHTAGRISALLELGSGFHPDLTGRENVMLNAAILGIPGREIEKRFDEIVEFAGVGEFIDQPIKHYSSGMYVRLGFSVAVHVNPEILIIDEVITVGDEQFQRRCYDHLYALRKQGVTIVVVTHALGTIQAMADHVAWLERGELQAVGPPGEIIERYLKRVNELERQRTEAPAPEGSESQGDSTADSAAGSGSGEIVITGFELLDANGATTPFAVSGEDAVVRMHFEARQAIVNPAFAVAIRHESGLVMSSATTVLDGHQTGLVEGSGHIDYRISPMLLQPATYDLYTSITDSAGQHAFFNQVSGFAVHVRAGHQPARPGYFAAPATWHGPEISRTGGR